MILRIGPGANLVLKRNTLRLCYEIEASRHEMDSKIVWKSISMRETNRAEGEAVMRELQARYQESITNMVDDMLASTIKP